MKHVVVELLLNIQRSCHAAVNSLELTDDNSRLLDSFEHISNLAQEAQRALEGVPDYETR
jgi:hypothetical protein